MPVEEGQAAPRFSLPANGDRTIALDDYLGHNIIVLYFYPKDQTPGCTIEAQRFRDGLTRLQEAGAVVLGVSPDTADSHDEFCQKEGLNFPLLADEQHEVSKTYGVWVEKIRDNNRLWGIDRSTFVIDRSGVIARVWHNVDVNRHFDEVLEMVNDLSANQQNFTRRGMAA